MANHGKMYEHDGSRHCMTCRQTWHQRNGVWDPEPATCVKYLTPQEEIKELKVQLEKLKTELIEAEKYKVSSAAFRAVLVGMELARVDEIPKIGKVSALALGKLIAQETKSIEEQRKMWMKIANAATARLEVLTKTDKKL